MALTGTVFLLVLAGAFTVPGGFTHEDDSTTVDMKTAIGTGALSNPSTRYANRFTEEFDSLDLIDPGNTTAAVDTYHERVLLSGAGGAGGSPMGHVSLEGFTTAMGTIFVNTRANFETHPIGALQQNHYAGIGISSMTASSGNVAHTAGPGQGNQGGAIQGEGPHQASRMLTSIRPNSNFKMDFASAQSGVGFMLVDKFSGGGVTLKGYTGIQGTGDLIATATAPNNNYQMNNMLFMGVTDGGVNSIRSIAWSIPNNGGDEVGIDDIRFGSTGIKSNLSYVQSKVVYAGLYAVGAARMRWYEDKPAGTEIVYNITADGEHWIRAENDTTIIFDHIGSRLKWNATLTTEDPEITPYIDRIEIDYDLVAAPEPFRPDSDSWQGTPRPTLAWNFTDPDAGDHQSHYRVEVYGDEEMTEELYNTSWTNSSTAEHTLLEDLPDGTYHWRVRTRDTMQAAGNFSGSKRIRIDVTKPTGSIVIEDGALTVNDRMVELAINATDNGSGVADMRMIGEDGEPGPWEWYDTGKGIVLTESDGMKTIGVQFRDNASIVSDVFNDTVYLDLLGPGDINISSSTHPDPTLYFNNTAPVFQWEPPGEMTAIKGYSYTFDDAPGTIPPKVLYTSNADATGTEPGEFSGLSDGAWYFHITSCDIYDQWGSVGHFGFNIDTTQPVISGLTPEKDVWFNTDTLVSTATFSDTGGFGLDTGSIRYSVRTNGGEFSPWSSQGLEVEVLTKGINDNPEKVSASAEITIAEGPGNAVRWRVTDLAENGPVTSPARYVRMDATPVTFSDPLPAEGEIFTETTVLCGITISDTGGSGVDGKSIEYSISHWGPEPEHFRNWSAFASPLIREEIEMLGELNFEAGKHNYVMWRAMDAVGNGHACSEPVRVRINSAPEPVLVSPHKGMVVTAGDAFELNANGTADPDGDELYYYWTVANKSSRRTVSTFTGQVALALLDLPGTYSVTLYVDDRMGSNESMKVDIYVSGNAVEDDDTGDGDDDGGREEKPSKTDYPIGSNKKEYPWLFLLVIAGAVLLLLVLAVILIVRRRKKKRDEERPTPGPAFPPAHPYSRGNYGTPIQPLHGPGPYVGAQRPGPGSPMQAQFQRPGGYPGLPGQGAPFLALPPGPGPAYGGQPPMGTGARQQFASGAAPAPALPQIAGATGAGVPYSLPSLPTEAGVQELSRLALPPAPEMDENAPLSPEPASTDPLAELLNMDFTQYGQGPAAVPEDAPTPPLEPAGQEEPAVPAPVPAIGDVPVDTGSVPGPETGLTMDAPMDAGDVPEPAPMPGDVPGSILPSTSLMDGSAPAPAPLPQEPAPTQPLVIQCHSCGASYEVMDNRRPIIVECPVCREQGYLGK